MVEVKDLNERKTEHGLWKGQGAGTVRIPEKGIGKRILKCK